MIRLANSSIPHLTKVARSILHMSISGFPDYGIRPHVAPASGMAKFQPDIMPADWDTLFQAVQTRLETCVSQALADARKLPLYEGHAATFQAVLECVADMRHLHDALAQERQTQLRH